MKTGQAVEVPLDRWQKAQNAELLCWAQEPLDGEDWNTWWSSKFSNYEFLKNENVDSVYEVGCGPYAKNIEHVFQAIGKIPNRVLLEDPLLKSYVILGKSVGRFMRLPNVSMISSPMEDFTLESAGIEPVDVVICNNVLDHVKSVEGCFRHMETALKPGGILILGQELTNEEDEKNHPGHDDIMHPIMIDESNLSKFLEPYEVLKYRVLSREEGRNPDYHCGTLLFVGRKK
jgi:SAM-dependent methyltransferase